MTSVQLTILSKKKHYCSKITTTLATFFEKQNKGYLVREYLFSFLILSFDHKNDWIVFTLFLVLKVFSRKQ
jgi:hypothetical protein